MNPRIQELAQQATEDILGVKVLNQQHFAELIVQECARVLEQQAAVSKNDRESYLYGASLIEEHFGIKE